MGIFSKKTKEEEKPAAAKADVKVEKKATKTPAVKAEKKVEKKDTKPAVKKVAKKKADGKAIKGGTDQAHKILVKPMITEKATALGALNKYVFEVNPKMNKVEIKKAIRSIYNVDPIAVNIANYSGKKVRFGRIKGQRKGWKKAIITLKAGDKIEVYEGV